MFSFEDFLAVPKTAHFLNLMSTAKGRLGTGRLGIVCQSGRSMIKTAGHVYIGKRKSKNITPLLRNQNNDPVCVVMIVMNILLKESRNIKLQSWHTTLVHHFVRIVP